MLAFDAKLRQVLRAMLKKQLLHYLTATCGFLQPGTALAANPSLIPSNPDVSATDTLDVDGAGCSLDAATGMIQFILDWKR